MRRVFLTGASGAIGHAIAERLLQEEHLEITAVVGSHPQAIDDLRAKAPGRVRVVSVDFGDVSSQAIFLEDMAKERTVYTDLVFAAGTAQCDLLQRVACADIRKVMEVDLVSPILCTRALLPAMLSAHRGTITYLASIWGVRGASCESAYSAAKGGLIAFARALSREVGPSGIRVNCLSPGWIATPMNDGFSEEAQSLFLKDVPLGRTGTPRDVAEAVAFLTSKEARYITGVNLPVDGGFL